jgi:hypothetical protein
MYSSGIRGIPDECWNGASMIVENVPALLRLNGASMIVENVPALLRFFEALQSTMANG